MKDRIVPLLLFLAGVTAASAVHVYSDYTLDDSFITYRYAENIAAGRGFVYNPGERELGTTTPLYTLLLAILARLGAGTGPCGAAIGILSFGGTVVLSRHLALKAGATPVLAGLFGLALCVCPPLLRDAISGMETSLYAFLCLAVVALCLDGRMAGFCVVGAACFLTRPDGAIVLAACGIHDLLTRRRGFPRWAMYAAVVAALSLPWFVFSFAYFGILLPNSGFAKLLQVDDWGHFARLIVREGTWLAHCSSSPPWAVPGSCGCPGRRSGCSGRCFWGCP
ncbi:MAG: hypothetical protein MUE73_13345 [Planctomycetes bacterium]|nr:hypothetical protein [Planctomycetota bacterium]